MHSLSYAKSNDCFEDSLCTLVHNNTLLWHYKLKPKKNQSSFVIFCNTKCARLEDAPAWRIKQPNRTAFLRKGFVKNLQKKFGNVLKQQASDFTSKIMACFVKNRHSKRIYCKRWSRSKGEIKPKSKKIFCKKERKQINCGLPCPINTMTMKTQHNFRGQVFCNWSNMLEFFEVLIYNDFRWINTWRSRLVWSRAHDWKSCNRQKRFEGSNLSFSAKE